MNPAPCVPCSQVARVVTASSLVAIFAQPLPLYLMQVHPCAGYRFEHNHSTVKNNCVACHAESPENVRVTRLAGGALEVAVFRPQATRPASWVWVETSRRWRFCEDDGASWPVTGP